MGNDTTDKFSSRYGMSFLEVLTIVFIVLKLIGKISWSWWWVLSPLWIPLILLLTLAIAYGIIAAIDDHS